MPEGVTGEDSMFSLVAHLLDCFADLNAVEHHLVVDLGDLLLFLLVVGLLVDEKFHMLNCRTAGRGLQANCVHQVGQTEVKDIREDGMKPSVRMVALRKFWEIWHGTKFNQRSLHRDRIPTMFMPGLCISGSIIG